MICGIDKYLIKFRIIEYIQGDQKMCIHGFQYDSAHDIEHLLSEV